MHEKEYNSSIKRNKMLVPVRYVHIYIYIHITMYKVCYLLHIRHKGKNINRYIATIFKDKLKALKRLFT